MSRPVRIDTLGFHRRLTDAGLTVPVADAIVSGLGDADLSGLATKTDHDAFRAETKAEFAAVRGEMKAEIAAMRGEMRALFGELRGEIFRQFWVMGLGIVGLTVALLKVLP